MSDNIGEQLTISATSKSVTCRYPAAHARADTWSRSSGDSVVSTEHAHSRTKLGSSERDHVLSNMGRHHLAMLRSGVVKNPLNKVVAVLIARNVNQGDSSAVTTTFADAIEVAPEKLGSSNLETFLNDFGCKLIGTVLSCVPNDMIDSAASVRRSAMFTNMLNAPVSKLTVRHNVNVGKYFFNARSL